MFYSKLRILKSNDMDGKSNAMQVKTSEFYRIRNRAIPRSELLGGPAIMVQIIGGPEPTF